MAPSLTREHACFCGPAGKGIVCCGFWTKVWDRGGQWWQNLGKGDNNDKDAAAKIVDKDRLDKDLKSAVEGWAKVDRNVSTKT